MTAGRSLLSARGFLLVGGSLLALAAPAAAQGPMGGTVTRGKAAISQTAERTVIRQTSRRAIVDWKRFDVGRDHEVVFDQAGRGAATLNRVQSTKPSVIAGAIRAPGTVIIQNAAGVTFTKDARVDAGGMVAASQRVDPGRFDRTGRLSIGGGEKTGARVVNHGTVTVGERGLAALVGGDVENAGVLVARRGTVALASGTQTTIDLSGDGLARVVVSGDGRASNSGRIDAAGGAAILTADDAARALDAAINTEGLIRADRVTLQGGGGKVRLAGAIDARKARRGGKVTVTGGAIEATSTARLDASGGGAGGRIRIGGDRRGAGPLPRAERLSVAEGATIAADGGAGRGGEITLWSEGVTAVAGAISATGAQGGAVETSGRFALDIAASARVEVGAGGSWLLDPRDIVIDDRGASVGGGTSTPPAGAGPWRVNAGAIVAALDGGADVTIATTAPGSDAGTIFVGANVTWSGDGDLRLVADDSLTVNYNMLSTGAGDLTLEAGTDFILDAKILSATGTGDLTIDAGRDLAIRAHPTNTRTISTEEGRLAIDVGRDVFVDRNVAAVGPHNTQIYSTSGTLDMTAGRVIDLRGGALGGTWVRVGQQSSSADVTLRAPTVSFRGGGAGNTYAELVGGADGSITVAASERIVFANGAGDQGRVQASNGASLTLRAPVQVWDGPVRAGSGAQDGGETVIAGAVSASFQPQFSLRRGANFTFEPAAQGGAASSYASTEPFEVTTSGAGAIEIGAPVSARQVTLVSAERVGLGLGGSLYGAGAAGLTDGVIVAAGRQFRNDSALGAGAVATGASARWLVYVNTFAGLVGPAPGPRSFDLYGRTYVSAPPENLGFPGNRIVYGERPILTLTGATISKTYGDAVTFGAGLPGYTVAGYRPGDSAATALAGAPVVTSPGAAAGAGVLGSPYAVNVAATASAQGYRLEFVPGTLIVRPAALTVHVDDQRRLYGGADPTLTWTATGFVNGEDARVITGALSTDATRSSDVGDYVISSVGLSNPNYVITHDTGALTVDPVRLSLRIDDQRRAYGSANPELTWRASGFVLGQDESVISGALATAATRASDVGTYAIGKGTLAAQNYILPDAEGALTVDPVRLSLRIDDQRRAYGSANPELTWRASGFVLGQDESVISGALATAATRASDVGTYAIGKGTLAAQNYILPDAEGALTVDPVRLSLRIDDQRRAYGSANPELTWRASGFVLGQDESVISGALATAATRASDVGTYAIGKGTLAAQNYILPDAEGALTVDPVRLSLRIDDQRRAYGSANPELTWRASGFVLGQDESVISGALATAATRASDVGTYAIGKGTLAAQNYILPDAEGALTVDPVRLSLRIDDQRRAYGSANPELTWRASGFVLGQDESVISGALATAATRASDVGTYAIGKGTLAAQNYILPDAEGALTVDPVRLSLRIDDQRRAYGSANPELTWRASGFVLGQDESVISGALATAATRASDVGTYAIGKGTLAAQNYILPDAEGALTVDPVRLSLRIDDQRRAYGSANPELTWRASGFVLGQDESVISGALATAATRASDVGTYAIGKGTLAAQNYILPDAEGALTVDPVRLSLRIDDQRRAYGSANPELTWRASGFVLGQDESVISGALATAATRASDVGTYAIGKGTLAAQNYILPDAEGALTVDPVRLSLRIDDQRRAYGSANPELTWRASGFVLGQDESVISGALATAATRASDVGTYAIGKGTLAAQNYILPDAEGALTVDPVRLSLRIDDQRRAYGSANPELTWRASGFVLGQDESVISGALATAATRASDVGTYAIGKGTLAAQNYILPDAEGALTVDPVRLSLRIDDQRRAYGSANPELTWRASGFVLGQDESVISGALATAATRASDVGTYAIGKGTLAAQNYILPDAEGALTVDPVRLSLRIDDQRRAYGSANPELTWRASGFVLGQDESVISGALATAATRASDVGTYAIGKGTLAAQNYILPDAEGALTVDPVRLSLRIDDQRRAYGSANPELTWRASGFVLGQDESVISGALATAATRASDVGTYAIGKGTLAAQNYILPDAEGALTVDPAQLTVTAEDVARRVGERNPTFTARFDGFVLGEDASVLTGGLRFATEAGAEAGPGRYGITPSGLAGANYAITYADGLLTVRPGAPAPTPEPVPVDAPGIADSLRIPARGLPPYTPGDSAFRTTQLEAPTARDSTFQLDYSLGDRVAMTPASDGTGGFAPAAGGGENAGFVPAAGGGAGQAEAAATGACGGPIALPSASACVETRAPDSFWSDAFGDAR